MYKIYLNSEGFITHTRRCTFNPDPGQGIIINRLVNLQTEYYRDGLILPRPIMPLSVIGSIISDIPIGTQVTIDATTYTVDDGVLELSFDTPGEHRLFFRKFPFQDKEVIIET